MKKPRLMRKIISAIALIMTIAIGLSACGISLKPPVTTTPTSETTLETTPVDTPTTPTTPESTTPAPGPGAPIDPPAHVCVFSDWVTIKAPSNTEDGLRERKCECGKLEQEIIEASNTEYSVEYRNLKSASYPSETGYNSKDGLLNLPQPEAVGYQFVGWYTASIGGNLVDYIPKGSKEDYILYAHWDLVSYEITYKNVPNNTNVTTYDIEDKVKLQTPEWSGLEFTHWTDANGNTYMPEANITFMPEKMSGDLVLTANWKVLRNTVTQNSNPELNIGYSTEDGYLFFYYLLGTIQHVVIDSKDDINNGLYYKSKGNPINYTLSQTVTIGEETAENISNTISTAVSQSTTISSSDSWAKNESKNWNSEIGGSFGFNYEVECGFPHTASITAGMSMEINGKTGKGGTSGENSGWEKSNSTTNSSSTETSKSVSSSLSFMKQISTTKQETIYVSEDQPSGYYAFVHAGNIEVYAVVIYNTKTGGLSMTTYSYLDNMHSMVMYYPDVESMNNPTADTLDFTIPKENIVNKINNSYYVKYDANGGTGTMPTTVHSVNGNEKLATNSFVRAGYEFTGWEVNTKNGVSILLDGQSVTNLAQPLHTITLKALWASTGPLYSEWSEWSDWTLERRETSDLVKEESATLWAYYYFKCPSCGVHMHGWKITCPTWAGGCGKAYIPESSWRWVFSEISYSAAGLKEWYGTGKYYTKINGQIVFNPEKGQMTVYRYSTRTIEEQ